jgi:CBS domain-containing protein
MTRFTNTMEPKRLVLKAETAEDLMTPNPVSIHQRATVHEAAALLTDREINAVPVIDDAGRPVGVLSRADIVRHDRETALYLPPSSDYDITEPTLASGEVLGSGFQVETTDATAVGDIMTPTIIAVAPGEPALRVVAEMLARKVHRLFVVDATGVLVGVISAFDVLRGLRAET